MAKTFVERLEEKIGREAGEIVIPPSTELVFKSEVLCGLSREEYENKKNLIAARRVAYAIGTGEQPENAVRDWSKAAEERGGRVGLPPEGVKLAISEAKYGLGLELSHFTKVGPGQYKAESVMSLLEESPELAAVKGRPYIETTMLYRK